MAKHLAISFFILAMAVNATAGQSTTETIVKKTMMTDTEVIEDHGGQKIDSYLPQNKENAKRQKENFDKRKSTRLFNAHFPVVSKSLSVGLVEPDEAETIKYQVAMRPIFIIGYDPISIKWLQQNQQLLSEKKAIGLVVNVNSQDEMNELQAIAGDSVMMQPTPGDNFAKELNIRHYPFYMDNQGVMRK